MNEDDILVEITATVRAHIGGKVLEFGLLPEKEHGMIHSKGLLVSFDMPDDFCELTGFRKLGNPDLYDYTSVRDAMRVASTVIPILFSLAMGKPMLAICQRKHAQWLERVFAAKPQYDFEILRGSLSIRRGYPSLDNLPGFEGVDDIHIIKISKASTSDK